MFHGSPGTGKTSTIKAIANVTKRHLINVRLSEVHTNTQLKNLFFNPVLQVVNPETLLVEKFIVPIHQRLYVIEDIDCMTDLIKRRDLQFEEVADLPPKPQPVVKPPKVSKLAKPKAKSVDPIDGDEELQSYYQSALEEELNEMSIQSKDDEARDSITLDSLLNILDGTLEIPDRMFCITTNHLEIIDPALIRPGRVDLIVEFKYCTKAIIKQMFESFYEREFDGAKFSKIKDYKISPAFVNQILFKYFTKPEAAIEELILFEKTFQL
jgi:SpoVK/Ycf46/Vps4 family AAA+-type ATPase